MVVYEGTGSNNLVWSDWNQVVAIQNLTSSIWSYWTSNSATSVTWNESVTWSAWNDSWTPTSDVNWIQPQRIYTPRETTADVIAREARKVERVAAEAKARKILGEHLSPTQQNELALKGYFHVEVGQGSKKRRYRVERKATHNVYLLDAAGKVEREFCTVLPDCPLEDQLLVQKLYLETNEKAFYEAANVWDHRGGLRADRSLAAPEKINRLRALLVPEEARVLFG